MAVQPPATPTPGHRQDPLVPTPLVGATLATPTPLASSTASPTPLPTVPPPPLAQPYSLRWRVGISVPDGRSPAPYPWPEARPGWYLNWSVGYTGTVWTRSPLTPNLSADLFAIPADEAVGMAFAPMVRVRQGRLVPPPVWLAATAAHLPGRTWLIGNEPDVKWQDNTPPELYARAYYTAYTTLKAADPTAQIAIAGVSQITPLRLAYLDAVLAAYQEQVGEEMPVDVWTMHAFVLQEKAGDWGVDIPPGMEADAGERWTIEQHDDLALVEEQIRRMRAWMRARGQQDKPLWITEYGILMPESYGFPPERVRRFLLGSFDLFRTLRDPSLGYPADEGRLVQRWVWFSTDDRLYPTGNLFTFSGAPTPILAAMTAYLAEYGE
ncbi:MAG TPA: hypothetical protein VNK95_01290 [Caldilineaceae bacterium]|nr:hypothetical protein [Caldilineaceae bacterium]